MLKNEKEMKSMKNKKIQRFFLGGCVNRSIQYLFQGFLMNRKVTGFIFGVACLGSNLLLGMQQEEKNNEQKKKPEVIEVFETELHTFFIGNGDIVVKDKKSPDISQSRKEDSQNNVKESFNRNYVFVYVKSQHKIVCFSIIGSDFSFITLKINEVFIRFLKDKDDDGITRALISDEKGELRVCNLMDWFADYFGGV